MDLDLVDASMRMDVGANASIVAMLYPFLVILEYPLRSSDLDIDVLSDIIDTYYVSNTHLMFPYGLQGYDAYDAHT